MLARCTVNLSVLALILILIRPVVADAASPSTEWRALLIPASLNPGTPVRLIAGHTQPLTLMLQAGQAVRTSDFHAIYLEFDLPPGTLVHTTGGQYELLRGESEVTSSGRVLARYNFMVRNNHLAGLPGERPLSEWRSQSFFVTAPDSLEDEQAYISLTLEHRTLSPTPNVSVRERWPLELLPLSASGEPLRRTWIGLWDYSLARADKASHEVGSFLAASGINFIQRADGLFQAGMKAHGILTGGYVHQSAFYGQSCPDVDVNGTTYSGDYSDPQCVIELPSHVRAPGVTQLADQAKRHDGWATFDFEPNPLRGFSNRSLAAFKESYALSDADIDLLRRAMQQSGRQTYLSEDPDIARLYRLWVTFRTGQVSRYVERINRELKEIDPEASLAITVNKSYGECDSDLTTLGYGTNAAALAPYCDVIMPQIYAGYGDVAVKHVIEAVQGWRAAMEKERAATTKLVPILLVRYAGATVRNSPSRVRQQIIGALSAGAQGVLLYYPSNMDAPYWQMLSETTRQLKKYEDFYHDGQRIDERFAPVGMPARVGTMTQYPGHPLTVNNPDWAYTAHELEGQTLVTLINLQSEESLVFDIPALAQMQVVHSEGVRSLDGSRWEVPAEEVGLLLLTSQP
ncbi:MAG: hypothetical protein ACOYEP_04515 [Limnochordia bacterium]|jgi:hypothetical protein